MRGATASCRKAALTPECRRSLNWWEESDPHRLKPATRSSCTCHKQDAGEFRRRPKPIPKSCQCEPWSRLLVAGLREIGGDVVENIRELSTDGVDRGDNHDGDAGGDQPILNRRSSLFVAQEPIKDRHTFLPVSLARSGSNH